MPPKMPTPAQLPTTRPKETRAASAAAHAEAVASPPSWGLCDIYRTRRVAPHQALLGVEECLFAKPGEPAPVPVLHHNPTGLTPTSGQSARLKRVALGLSRIPSFLIQ
jgi:hypothetical protein